MKRRVDTFHCHLKHDACACDCSILGQSTIVKSREPDSPECRIVSYAMGFLKLGTMLSLKNMGLVFKNN